MGAVNRTIQRLANTRASAGFGLTLGLLALLCGVSLARAQEPVTYGPSPLKLSESPRVERQTVDRLLTSRSWARRAIAALRLERYGCAESLEMLSRLRRDQSWQVRCFAVRTLARRGIKAEEDWFSNEDDPRVLRAALRYRYELDTERLGRGVRVLSRSSDLMLKMLAVELGAASGDEDLIELATETARTIILRMDRAEGGALGPRLAIVTGHRDEGRDYFWRMWLRDVGRRFAVHPAYAIGEDGAMPPLPRIATIEPELLQAMERYIEKLNERQLDLCIVMDCTSSMYGELAEAQGGVSDMMTFLGDVIGSARIAIVAYRDQRDEFETWGMDFTESVEQARNALWKLRAEGGGDRPESVHPAMRGAYTQLSWILNNSKVLVLIGDAPPRVGTGSHCVDLARRAHEDAQLITHVIQCTEDEVKHFPEIAEAGGGRLIPLADDDALVAEITGLTLGEAFEQEFREFFNLYLELCR